jgi:hypothetical protein
MIGTPVVILLLVLKSTTFVVPEEWNTPDHLRNALRVFEMITILGVAYFWSARSMRGELSDGSWVLLKQTPVSVPLLLVGRAVGVASMILALHSFCFFPIVLFTPFVNIRTGDLALEFFIVWILAIGLVPEGFFAAVVWVARRRGVLFARVAGIVRIAVVVLLVRMLLRPDALSARKGVFDVLDAFVGSLYRETAPPASSLFSVPSTAAAILILWWCLSGVGVWRLCLSRLRR